MNQINAAGSVATLVHFISEIMKPPVNSEGPPVPQWRIACMPNMTEFGETPYHPCYHRTNEVRAVTCPACKRTPAFSEAHKRLSDAEAASR